MSITFFLLELMLIIIENHLLFLRIPLLKDMMCSVSDESEALGINTPEQLKMAEKEIGGRGKV